MKKKEKELKEEGRENGEGRAERVCSMTAQQLSTLSFQLSTIISLLLLGIFPGCTRSVVEEQERPVGPAIRLMASTLTESAVPGDLPTRGAIYPGDSFTAGVAGWESSGSPVYGSAAAWVSGFKVTAGTPLPVALTPEVYYNVSSSVRTYMKAWYPAGTLAEDGKVAFGTAPDGSTDVMLTSAVSGSRDDTQNKQLGFCHLLSQLRFRVQVGANVTVRPTLTSMTVHDVQLPAGIDLTTDTPIRAAASDFTLTGIEPGKITFTPSPQGVGDPLLLCPFGGNTLTVDIVTSEGTHRNVVATIDGDEAFVAGKAYTITLTYTGKSSTPLEVNVSVTPWEDVWGGDTEI